MQTLPIETLQLIATYLNTNKDVLYLLSVTKGSDRLKPKFLFTKFPFCKYNKPLCTLPYYKNIAFTFYCCSQEQLNNIPENTRHVYQDCKGYISKKNLPKTVTHYTLGRWFQSLYSVRIPKTVTHLQHFSDFSMHHVDRVPKSVTHLTIVSSPSGSVLGFFIPASISHLIFDGNFHGATTLRTISITTCIEFNCDTHCEFIYNIVVCSSVTKLIFDKVGWDSVLNMRRIPDHIKEIVFHL